MPGRNAPASASGNIILFIFTRHFYDREHLSSGNKNVTDTRGSQHYNITAANSSYVTQSCGNYEQLNFITSYIIVLRTNKK